MLSEISQTKRNTAWCHLHVKCEKKKKKMTQLIETESSKAVAEG